MRTKITFSLVAVAVVACLATASIRPKHAGK
jgi:hypothetical protein